ncbi:MAG: biotin/lipoyl-containing protein, partial [Brevundimonas sp.]|nr:biotin/lipoyl-containing protein [Brevundimonas sp.]
EVQVFGDSHGTVVHLYERDCSLQRRHQKVIEEAPAPGMDAATRAAVTDAAVRAAKAVNYEGAGTIEFIADASEGLKADRIWFMEMNTRLQVEHPVTEAVTGVDLVEWQFRVAAGEPMPLKQADIPLNGWAMEARLYAEDPANGFLPSIGRLEHFRISSPRSGEGDREAVEGWRRDAARRDDAAPGSVRVDTGVEEGGEVSQFYDPMIAKLIVHADTREEAAEALADACASVEVWPVRTNAGFLVRCLEHPRFVRGDVDTGFIGAEGDELVPAASPAATAAVLEMVAQDIVWAVDRGERSDAWSSGRGSYGFRLNAAPSSTVAAVVEGEKHLARLGSKLGGSEIDVSHAGKTHQVSMIRGNRLKGIRPKMAVEPGGHRFGYRMGGEGAPSMVFERGLTVAGNPFAVQTGAASGPASDGALRAPMPGKIVATPAKPGDTVTKGQPVVVLEAMKMEHALVAPFDGVVSEIGVAVGDQVAADAVLATVNASN